MGTRRFSDRRVLNALAGISLLVGMALPSFMPAFASAAQITSRSVDLSSNTVSATSVNYSVTFTPVSNAAGFLIDFCSDTPLAQQSCTAPTGFDTTGVGTSTGSASVQDLQSNSGVLVTKALTGGSAATVVLTGITNPSTLGTFYARIVTYTDVSTTVFDTPWDFDNTTLQAGATDSGGVALATANSVGVSAAVLESMTFCVSGTDTSGAGHANCGGSLAAPSLVLGVTSGGATALQSNTLSTGTVYTQISTNAAAGAVISMKSNATDCGGLLLIGTSGCFIHPAPGGGFSAGTADFGVKTGSAASTTGASSPTGTLEPVSASGYNNSTFFMHFVAGNGSGVTGPYGDPILDTSGAPINNQNMPLTFGASINNNTPAGLYSANINLIANGTF